MPHPVLYVGTDDDDQTRSIDFVHIEPSIREGVHLVSSLYGRDASSPLYRTIPTNTFPPYISGSAKIPSRLICLTGQWAGSPTPLFAFQWMRDGADIPGANSYEYFTTVDDDNTVITCEVRGYNYMGEAYVLSSNSIAVGLVEPIETREQENYIVTGLDIAKVQNVQDEREVIVTGLGAEDRIDLLREEACYLTGLGADLRHDINQSDYHIITGLHQDDTLSILERTYGIAVVSRTIGEPLVSGVPQPLRLINPQAEMGMVAWNTFGTIDYSTTLEREGNYSWWGGRDADPAQNNTPYVYMWQDVPMYDVHVTDIDASSCFVNITFFQSSLNAENMANIRLEFYAADQTTRVGLNDGPGLWATPAQIWWGRELDVPIPVGTRFIRVIPEFNLVEGTDIEAYIDSITMQIRKGSKIFSYDSGPTFEQWRLRFTQANTYSGGGLSELEFRSTPGALDLAVGGSPIFGSAGNGVVNADFAFDDLKNTGYWCGDQLSIAEGTSWLGYNMGTLVRPQELAITARLGSEALQVPRQFVLEGSDDGVLWTPVHEVDEFLHNGGINYTSGETKTVPIPVVGSYPFYRDHPDVGTVIYARSNFSTDDQSGKAMIMQAVSRFEINQLSARIDDNSNTPFNYRIQLYRVGGPNNFINSDYNYVTDVLEDFLYTSPGTTSGPQWVNTPVFTPHKFEIGDRFMIRFYDIDAATNPVDDNEGRIAWVHSWGDGSPSEYSMRRLAKRIRNWDEGNEVLVPGDYNVFRYIGDLGRIWTLDFSGNVY